MFHLVHAASAAIKKIQSEVPVASFYVAATGDITTAGDPRSFHLAREFFEKRDLSCAAGTYPIGLALAARTLVVPGNHDRYRYNWLGRQNDSFEEAFCDYIPCGNWEVYRDDPRNTSASALPELPSVRVVNASTDLSFIFVGIDSTALNFLESTFDFAGRIAQGRVSDKSIKYLRKLNRELARTGSVTSGDGTVHDLRGKRVIKVLLLHHHPHLPSDLKQEKLTRLLNAGELKGLVHELAYHLVLFGHEHVAFADSVTLGAKTSSPAPVLFGAAGSMSMYDEANGNSFNVFRFDARSVTHELWRSNGVQFECDGTFRHPLRPAEIQVPVARAAR